MVHRAVDAGVGPYRPTAEPSRVGAVPPLSGDDSGGPGAVFGHPGRSAPVTLEIAREWGAQSKAQPVPVVDALIAATARVHGWTLVTRNVKDFDPTGVRVLNPFTD